MLNAMQGVHRRQAAANTVSRWETLPHSRSGLVMTAAGSVSRLTLMNAYPLLQAYPRLADALPVAGLLSGPTPVVSLGNEARVFLKRDDLSAPDFGGNKVRKLDFILGAAQQRGVRELITFGYTGSNFVAATAWHGRKLALRTIAYLLRQVDADYIADNLAISLHAGAELHLLNSTTQIAAAAVMRSGTRLLRTQRLPLWIPPGGSSPLGVIGFINAAFELKRQVQAGELPQPERIYVAFSSMGTVAGLALGLELAGLDARIEAVQVVDAAFAGTTKLQQLANQTCRLLRRIDPSLGGIEQAIQKVRIRTDFFGEGYACPTSETRPAMERFIAGGGSRADTCYTGKALACIYSDLDAGRLRGENVLFWHTLNAHGMPAGVQRPVPERIPEAFRCYFNALC